MSLRVKPEIIRGPGHAGSPLKPRDSLTGVRVPNVRFRQVPSGALLQCPGMVVLSTLSVTWLTGTCGSGEAFEGLLGGAAHVDVGVLDAPQARLPPQRAPVRIKRKKKQKKTVV
eukprot:1109197-Rhodomonas_salina.1